MKIVAVLLSLFCLTTVVNAEVRTKSKRRNPATSTYQPTTEAQCSEIDLRGERCPDGSPRLPALRSQGLTNYCFAFSTTDLISFASCRNFSALSSGIISALSNPNPPKDPAEPVNLGGSPRELLQTLRLPDQGPCLESQFPSSPEATMPQSKTEGIDANRTHNFLMTFYERRANPNPLNCARQPVTGVTFNERIAPEATIRNEQLQQALKEALEIRHEPAGVHVKSNLVMSNNIMGSERPAAGGTDHFVSVVGRRWINGSCHYLYRDQNPMQGSPWPRAEDHPQQAPSLLPASDYFYIWVREENLLNNADDVIFNVN